MTSPIQTVSPMTLSGQVDQVLLIDPGGQPNTVISTGTAFQVQVDWSLSGSSLPFLGGEFTVRALVESIGPGFEGQVGPTKVVAVAAGPNYSTVIDVPANTLPQPAAGDDTVYKLVALVSHRNLGAKTRIAGFGEGTYFEIQVP